MCHVYHKVGTRKLEDCTGNKDDSGLELKITKPEDVDEGDVVEEEEVVEVVEVVEGETVEVAGDENAK